MAPASTSLRTAATPVSCYVIVVIVVVVCPLSAAALASYSQGCTVTWSNKTDMHSFGAVLNASLTSSADCLDYCVTVTSCAAVEIDLKYSPIRCWVYTDPTLLNYAEGLLYVNQYIVVGRVCATTTTTVLPTSTTSSHAQVCTITWSNKTNVHSYGAVLNASLTSSADCLDYCVTVTSCVAVEIDLKYSPIRCWVYTDPTLLLYTDRLGGINQYIIVNRTCSPAGPGCTTRWNNFTNTHSAGAFQLPPVASLSECLDRCVANLSCAGVDVDSNVSPVACWMHTDPDQIAVQLPSAGVNQYQLVTRCPPAETPQSCQPTWQRYNNSNSDGGSLVSDRRSESDCLAYCASLPSCVGVDIRWSVNPLECWVHTSRANVNYRNSNAFGVTQFVIVRQCSDQTSTTSSTRTSTTTTSRTSPTSTTTMTTTTTTTATTTTTTTMTTTTTDRNVFANCVPVWQIHNNTHSFGGVYWPTCSGIALCLECCTNDTACVAVDIDTNFSPERCYVYRELNMVEYQAPANGVNQYQRTGRTCTSGTSTSTSMKTTPLNTATTTTTTTKSAAAASSTSVATMAGRNTPSTTIPPCGSTSFFCDSGSRCLPQSSRCNNVAECVDMTDELNCGQVCRQRGGVSCANGLCVLPYQWCDRVVDCTDFSDELSCSTCGSSDFRCSDGACVDQSLRCDGVADCASGDDEFNCSCSSSKYKCQDAMCIPLSLVCDGVLDCPGGDDEEAAICRSCSAGQFRCSSDYSCIAMTSRCDSINDCADGSDEQLCLHFRIRTAERRKRAADASAMYPAAPTPLVSTFGGSNFYYFCADNWNQDWSNFACQQMGYVRSVTYSTLATSSSQLLVLTSSSATYQNILQEVTNNQQCVSRQQVSVSCASRGCGWRTVGENMEDGFINSGFQSTPGSWPWHVSLFVNGAYQCAGSIISEDWVLTSARCVLMPDSRQRIDVAQLAVRAGSVYLSTYDADAQISFVRTTLVHPTFFDDPKYDIALVRLSTRLNFTLSVQPICLPGDSAAADPDNYVVCAAAGWSRPRVSTTHVTRQNVLRHVRVTSQPLARCSSDDELTSSMDSYVLCGVAEAANSTCVMQTGGAWVCEDLYGHWTQVGIARTPSSDERCSSNFFTNLSAFIDWINLTKYTMIRA